MIGAVATLGKRFPMPPEAGDGAAPSRLPDGLYIFWPERVRAIVPLRWSGDFAAVVGSPLRFNAREQFADPASDVFLSSEFENLRAIGLARMLTGERIYQGDVAETWADFGDALKSAGRDFARVVQALGPIVGLIPGIGQGVAAVIAAATAIALAQPLDEAIVSIAANAIPGGALARDVFVSAAAAGSKLLDGKNIVEAGIAAGEAAAKAQGPLYEAAYEAGVAVARGKSLQDAGFKALHAWVGGNDLAERASALLEKAARAAEQGKSVRDFMLDEAQDALTSVATAARTSGLRSAIDALVKEPADRLLPLVELAEKLRVPIEIARAAIMSVTEDGREDTKVSRRFLSMVDPRATYVEAARRAVFDVYASAAEKRANVAIADQSRSFDRLLTLTQRAGAAPPSLEREAPPSPAPSPRHDLLLGLVVVAAIGALAYWHSKGGA